MFVPFSSSGMSVSRFSGILYVVTLIPELKSFIRMDRISDVLLWGWGFFGLLTLVSLLNINEISKDFFNISMFQNIVLFWFLINHARKDYLILEKGMLIFAFGAIAVAVMYLMGINVEYEDGRLTMFKENQNVLGLKMCLGLVVLMANVVQDKLKIGKLRYLFLTPIPVMVNFIFATGSRLAFLSLLLCLITGIILIRTKRSSDKILAVIIGVITLFILGISLMQSEVLKERLLNSVKNGDSSGRNEIWTNIMPLIRDNPIIGVGITGYHEFTANITSEDYSSHNVILEVMCYTGIIGLACFLSFIYLVFARGIYSYDKNGWLLPIFLIFPVVGLILSGQILDVKLGWVVFAYIISTSAIKMNINNIKIPIHENPLCHR